MFNYRPQFWSLLTIKHFDAFLEENTITFSSILTNEIMEITYTTIKGTVTMALGTSTVCTYVYDNSKCIGEELRGRHYYFGP